MNILIFLPYGGVSPHHFSIGLEIIQEHLNKGNSVTILDCKAHLNACSFNVNKSKSTCIECISIYGQGMKLIEGNYRLLNYKYLKAEDKLFLKNLNFDFITVEDLKKTKIEDYDIGIGVLASIVSYHRNPNFDFQSYLPIIKKLFYASCEVYLSIKNHLITGNYDEVYLFNGRYSEFRAVFRAAQSLKINAKLYEYGSDLSKYAVFDNYLPHSIINTTKLINTVWEECKDHIYRKEKGEEFYKNNRKGIEKSYYSYIKDQDSLLLPKNFNNQKTNIVIYNSSEDEMTAIDEEWVNDLYVSQVEGIIKIIKSVEQFEQSENYHVYLRIHPNLKSLPGDDSYTLKNFKSNIFTFIPADSDISSYNLLDNADIILTFASTVGIEATFWDKPSILLGPSAYQNLGAAYTPKSHEEVIALLQNKNLSPLNKEGAVKYGFYMNTFGIDKKISKMSGFIKLESLKGQVLKPDPVAKFKMDVLFVLNNPLKYLKLKLNRLKKAS
jgi:hypothetical protein